MTVNDLVLAVLIPLALAEFGQWCEWIAKRILPLAASLRYGSGDRADVRSEEWIGHLGDIPGQLSKLTYALGHLLAGSALDVERRVLRPSDRLRQFLVTRLISSSSRRWRWSEGGSLKEFTAWREARPWAEQVELAAALEMLLEYGPEYDCLKVAEGHYMVYVCCRRTIFWVLVSAAESEPRRLLPVDWGVRTPDVGQLIGA
jgi:hypothetical protein